MGEDDTGYMEGWRDIEIVMREFCKGAACIALSMKIKRHIRSWDFKRFFFSSIKFIYFTIFMKITPLTVKILTILQKKF